MNDLPNVSILTPTWDRPNFLPLMIHNVTTFDYPKEKLEWVIMDDHPDNPLFEDGLMRECLIKEVQKKIFPIKLKYIYDKRRHLTIGEKRNRLVKEAKYKICAYMDDDDIYMPTYLSHSIGLMKKNKTACVGCNAMLFVYPLKDYQISHIQCEAKRQAHEATMVFTKKYFNSMGGFPKSSQGEGAKFIDFNENNVSLSDIRYVMICVCHKGNTCNKDIFLDKKIDVGLNREETPFKLLEDIFNPGYSYGSGSGLN